MAQLEMFPLGSIRREPSRRVLSYGGGLDSFALLLLALERGIRLDAVVFVDVGDPDRQTPGEWPGTYRHILQVAAPLCATAGIEFVWITAPPCCLLAPRPQKVARVQQILAHLERIPIREGERSLFHWLRRRRQIPVAGPNRICTTVAKVERFERWMASRHPGELVEVWIGFEAGEEERAAKDPNAGGRATLRVNRFPLIEWGFCRCRCEEYVRHSGFAVPRKSACVFCPYGSRGDWKTFAEELPGQFRQVVQLEADKPPTRAGKKLSIMGFRTLKDRDGNPIGYKATPLPEFILGTYRPKAVACIICGAPVRASKATGCGYVVESTIPHLGSSTQAADNPPLAP